MPPLELDHIIYAAPTLEAGVDAVEQQLGMRPVYGGRHDGRGTHNALLGLGDACYLEVIAPDPAQRQVSRPLWMGVDQVTAPGLIGWAVRTSDLSAFRAAALAENWVVGSIAAGERRTASGDMLRWRLTEPSTHLADGIFPFAIDWGDTLHPAARLPQVGVVGALEIQTSQVGPLGAVQSWLPMLTVTLGSPQLMLRVRDEMGALHTV
ncbi:MAG: VOC family protein [Bacteroidota bacterium]